MAWQEGEDERDYFNAFIHAFGAERDGTGRMWVPPADMVRDGICWTGAWDLARRIGGQYVEGTCTLTQDDGSSVLVRAHAWVEKDGQLVEVTHGYERTTRYKGFAMSPRDGGPAHTHSRLFDLTTMGRCSVIELLIVMGWTAQDIHDLLKET